METEGLIIHQMVQSVQIQHFLAKLLVEVAMVENHQVEQRVEQVEQQMVMVGRNFNI